MTTVDPPVLTLGYASNIDTAAQTVFSFDGRSSITGEDVSFPVSGATVMLWIKAEATAANGVILGYAQQTPDNAGRFWVKNPGNLSVGIGASAIPETHLNCADGAWHHVAITVAPLDGKTASVALFIDGICAWRALGAILNSAGLAISPEGDLVLGQGLTSEPGLSACMSQFVLWNSVLSDAAILSAMQIRPPSSGSMVVNWALLSPETSGTVSGGAFVVSDPALRFRSNRTLTASWMPAAVAGTTFELAVISSDCVYHPAQSGLTSSPTTVPSPQPGVTYTACIRAVSGSTIGAWSAPATSVALDLGQAAPVLPPAAATPFTLGWPAIDQATKYVLSFLQDGATQVPPSGTQSETSVDVTALVQDTAHTCTYTVYGTGGGSSGPLSASAAMAAAPTLALTYGPGIGGVNALVAAWPLTDGATSRYLSVSQIKSGVVTPVVATILSGEKASYVVPVVALEGDVFSATLRGLTTGTIGPRSNVVQITIHVLNVPVFGTVTSDYNLHTLTVPWTFSAPQGVTVAFDLQLWNADKTAMIDEANPATSPHTFTNAAIVAGATINLRIRAYADGSTGAWSDWLAVVPTGVPKVLGVSANVDAYGTITASWLSVLEQNPSLQGVTYVISLYREDGTVFYTAPEQSGLTIQMLRSITLVQEGATYILKIYAKATGLSPGIPSDPYPLTIGKIEPYPPAPPKEISDPVSVGSGAFTYMDVDLVVNGTVPLMFSTYYSSEQPLPSENALYSALPLGNRWNHAYNTVLKVDRAGGYVYILWGRGGAERYAIPKSGTFYANAGASLGSVLSRNGDGSYTLVHPGVKTFQFDSDGKLTAIIEPDGNRVTLSYTGQKLSAIEDIQSGHKLTLVYDGDWLHTVSDGARTVTYAVSGGNLVSMTDPRGKTRRFTYVSNAASLIETIVDFSGITSVKNTYQDGKIKFQQDARALAGHQSYGTQFDWTTSTYAMTESLVASVTDRSGGTARYESLKGNGALVQERYALSQGNILIRTHSYDGFANLLSTVEYRGDGAAYHTGMGNTVTYTYASCGRVATAVRNVTAANVSVIANNYDGNGNLLTTEVYEGAASAYRPGKGNVTTRHYNADNTLQWVQPPLGEKIQYTYCPGNVRGHLKTYTDALGNVYAMTWRSDGLPDTVTDPYGAVTTYAWSNAGFPLGMKVQAADGTEVMSWIYTVNEQGQVLTAKQRFASAGQTDSQSFLTTLTYNDNGKRQTLTDPTGAGVTYVYDENNNLTSLSWSPFRDSVRTTSWTFDRNNFLSGTILSPSQPTVQESYINNQLGERTQLTDPRNAIFTYGKAMTPAASGPLPSVATRQWPAPAEGMTAPLTSATYDPLGRVTQYVDRAGLIVAVAYVTQTDSATNTQQTVVTETRPPAAKDGPQTVTQTTYDALGRPTKFVDEAGKIWNWTYGIETDVTTQKFVQVSTYTDPTQRSLAMATDSYGRVAFVRESGGGLMRIARYAYDAIGRLVGVTVTNGGNSSATVLSYGYDAVRHGLTMTVGRPGDNGGETILTYNGRNELVRRVDPFGQESAYSYAPWGALGNFSDGRGNAFAYDFDPAGRLYAITLPDTTKIVQTTDASGNRLNTQIGSERGVSRTFDAWNRMLSRTDAKGHTVSYMYWPEGQLKQLTYPEGKKISCTLDGLGRLDTLTDWKARSVTYAWEAIDQVKSVSFKTTGGSVYAVATYSYDDAGRANGYCHRAGNLVLTKADYTFDGLGQPATASLILPMPPALPSEARTLTYTAANQIDTMDGAKQSYDSGGNYLGPSGATPVARYDAYGRIAGYGADTYGYDLDGLRTGTTLGGAAISHVYDIADWQSPQVERGDPRRAVTDAKYLRDVYGEDCMRPQYVSGLGPLLPFAALDRLIASYDAAGTPVARFIHGVGLLGGEDANGVFAAALSDNVGNIVARVSESGEVVDRAVYGPYGDLYARAAQGASPFLFNGRDGVQTDGNGLLHMRARGYMPSQFRFLQPDYLLGDALRPQSLNRYAFALGNPMQMSDPAGLEAIAAIVVGSVVALGAVFAAAYCIWGGGGAAAAAGTGAVGGLGSGLGGLGARGGGGNLGNGNVRSRVLHDSYSDEENFGSWSEESGSEVELQRLVNDSPSSRSESFTSEGSVLRHRNVHHVTPSALNPYGDF